MVTRAPYCAGMSIRVGFLGAGLIAAYHAIQLNELRDRAAADPGSAIPPHRIVSVFDPDRDRAAGLAGGQGAEVAADPDEVIDASDVVFVCTWTSEHLPLVRRVAAAGRALFCEKPLSVDLDRSRELVDVVTDAGLVNMVGLVMRSAPTLLVLREMVDDPASGRVMNVVFRDDQYIPVQGMYASTWRGDRSLAGSGALLEHSIHDLDLLEWLVGDAVSVSAVTAGFHGIAGIEDSVSALLSFDGGHSATLTSVWHDVLARSSQRRMEVFCERAVFTLDSDDVGPVRWHRDGTVPGEVDEGGVEGEGLAPWLTARGVDLTSAEEQFLRAVATGAPSPSPTVRDALRAHVLADAVYRSAAAGGAPVDVSRAAP